MKKTVIILLTAAVVFCAGSVVAYYNTASVGYDNANLISFCDDGIQVMDFRFFYQDFWQFVEKVKESAPDNFITI